MRGRSGAVSASVQLVRHFSASVRPSLTPPIILVKTRSKQLDTTGLQHLIPLHLKLLGSLDIVDLAEVIPTNKRLHPLPRHGGPHPVRRDPRGVGEGPTTHELVQTRRERVLGLEARRLPRHELVPKGFVAL